MKQFHHHFRFLFLLLCFFLISLSTFAATSTTRPKPVPMSIISERSHSVASTINVVTGVAVSPLLALSVLGAYDYFQTPVSQRVFLSWYQSPYFWGPLLLILLLIVFKDTIKLIAPIPKQLFSALDAVEAFIGKLSGVMALIVLLSSFNQSPVGSQVSFPGVSALFPGTVVHAATSSVIHNGQGMSTVSMFAMSLCIILIFTVVFLFSFSINILILISPFAFLDMLLKLARNTVLVILLICSCINPYLGLVVSLTILLVGIFTFGWAYRLTVFGVMAFWDLSVGLVFKRSLSGPFVPAFASKKLGKLKNRTYGKLYRSKEGKLKFHYRRFGLFSRSFDVEDAGDLTVNTRLLFPLLVKADPDSKKTNKPLFRLRLRCRKQETRVKDILNMG